MSVIKLSVTSHFYKISSLITPILNTKNRGYLFDFKYISHNWDPRIKVCNFMNMITDYY